MQQFVRRRDLFRLPLALALRPRPWPGGTFLQFWSAHLIWDDARWSRLYQHLSEIGVTELVVQWSRYDDIGYVPLVLRAADECDARDWTLHAGLAHHSQWWTALEQGPAARAQALARAFAAHLECARELAPLARRRCFRGWYLPEEIDDVHWQAAAGVDALCGHLSRLHHSLHPLSAGGFTSGRAAPSTLARFWAHLRRESKLDTVLFQDGIGAGNLSLPQWETLLPVLSRSVGPRRLRVVVEAFEQISASGPFQARPAPVERIEAQTTLARRWTRRPPIAFSFPEYFTPEGGAEARARFELLRGPHGRQ
ncbi:MAG: DUF4434 domain-containing protein [Candidatus Solibacter usitatus]|nr:DUF4434 domain-containing protein [Candidatus Solibacter usitatus]